MANTEWFYCCFTYFKAFRFKRPINGTYSIKDRRFRLLAISRQMFRLQIQILEIMGENPALKSGINSKPSPTESQFKPAR